MQDEHESLKMEFEESVKIESDDKSKKSNKKCKTQIVKPEVDVTVVKDAKGFVERVIEARGLEKKNCEVQSCYGQGSRFKVQGWGGRPL